MKPYYEDDYVTLYYGDCRELLPDIEADAVVMDPPYGMGVADWDGSTPYDLINAIVASVPGTALSFGAGARLSDDLPAYEPRPDRVLVWAPKFRLGKSAANGIAYRWHPIFCWRLPKSHVGGPVWDVLDHGTEGHQFWFHPGTKPVSLMRQLMPLTEGTIFDPFAGSGSTLIAAKSLNRKAIGIEIEERYCEVAATRLRQEVLGLDAGVVSST